MKSSTVKRIAVREHKGSLIYTLINSKCVTIPPATIDEKSIREGEIVTTVQESS